jgi:hypothetical protein
LVADRSTTYHSGEDAPWLGACATMLVAWCC